MAGDEAGCLELIKYADDRRLGNADCLRKFNLPNGWAKPIKMDQAPRHGIGHTKFGKQHIGALMPGTGKGRDYLGDIPFGGAKMHIIYMANYIKTSSRSLFFSSAGSPIPFPAGQSFGI